MAEQLANAISDSIDILHIVDFATIESWLNGGVPANEEIIRVSVPFSGESSATTDVAFDLGSAFGIEATDLALGGQLDGQLVLGFDTNTDPFYVLTGQDELRPDVITDVQLGLEAQLDIENASLLEGLISVPSAKLTASADLDFDLTSTSPKLRVTNLSAIGVSASLSDFAFDFAADAADLFAGQSSDVIRGGLGGVTARFDADQNRLDLEASRAEISIGGVVNVAASLVHADFQVDGTDIRTALRFEEAAVGIPGLLEIEDSDVALDLNGTVDPSGVQVDGGVTIGAETVALFPDESTPEVDGIVTASSPEISLTFSESGVSSLELKAASASGAIEDVFSFSAEGTPELPALQLSLGSDAEQLGSVRNLSVDVIGLENWPSELSEVDELTIRRDGFAVSHTFDPIPDFSVESILQLSDVTLGLDLDVRLLEDQVLPQILGGIQVQAGGGQVLPGTEFVANLVG